MSVENFIPCDPLKSVQPLRCARLLLSLQTGALYTDDLSDDLMTSSGSGHTPTGLPHFFHSPQVPHSHHHATFPLSQVTKAFCVANFPQAPTPEALWICSQFRVARFSEEKYRCPVKLGFQINNRRYLYKNNIHYLSKFQFNWMSCIFLATFPQITACILTSRLVGRW